VARADDIHTLPDDLPVPEDWSILVEKATQLPEQQPSTRQQQMAQQQQTRRRVNLRSLDI